MVVGVYAVICDGSGIGKSDYACEDNFRRVGGRLLLYYVRLGADCAEDYVAGATYHVVMPAINALNEDYSVPAIFQCVSEVGRRAPVERYDRHLVCHRPRVHVGLFYVVDRFGHLHFRATSKGLYFNEGRDVHVHLRVKVFVLPMRVLTNDVLQVHATYDR